MKNFKKIFLLTVIAMLGLTACKSDTLPANTQNKSEDVTLTFLTWDKA